MGNEHSSDQTGTNRLNLDSNNNNLQNFNYDHNKITSDQLSSNKAIFMTSNKVKNQSNVNFKIIKEKEPKIDNLSRNLNGASNISISGNLNASPNSGMMNVNMNANGEIIANACSCKFPDSLQDSMRYDQIDHINQLNQFNQFNQINQLQQQQSHGNSNSNSNSLQGHGSGVNKLQNKLESLSEFQIPFKQNHNNLKSSSNSSQTGEINNNEPHKKLKKTKSNESNFRFLLCKFNYI